KFIGTQHLADDQIIGAIVAEGGSATREDATLPDDYLMGVQQSRQLNRDLFSAARRTLDLGGFSHIRSHGNADAAQKLNPLGDGVNQLNLFVEVLVVEQMQLIEGWTGNLPMRLLV